MLSKILRDSKTSILVACLQGTAGLFILIFGIFLAIVKYTIILTFPIFHNDIKNSSGLSERTSRTSEIIASKGVRQIFQIFF